MSDDSKPPGGVPKLPQSGLADEILDQLRRGRLDSTPGSPESREPADQPTPAAERADVERIYTFTDSLQFGEEETEEREVLETWVEFRLADDSYALPVAEVREILRVREVTPVPHPPFPVIGVINLRGRVVPLLDLRSRLSLPAPAPDGESRVVLVESERRRIGLLVDGVERVAQLAPSAMVTPEPGSEAAEVRGLVAEDGRQIRLLDLTAVLTLRD